MNTDFSNLKRPRHPTPDFIKRDLEERGLMEAYEERPAYQQNDYYYSAILVILDYISWFRSALNHYIW